MRGGSSDVCSSDLMRAESYGAARREDATRPRGRAAGSSRGHLHTRSLSVHSKICTLGACPSTLKICTLGACPYTVQTARARIAARGRLLRDDPRGLRGQSQQLVDSGPFRTDAESV